MSYQCAVYSCDNDYDEYTILYNINLECDSLNILQERV